MEASSLQGYGLTVESRREPLGLDVLAPRFAWQLAALRRGARPRAYRIQVWALGVEGDRSSVPAWDSGWVVSPDGASALYQGVPLVSATRYSWQLSIEDDRGKRIDAGQSWFETGLLREEERVANWMFRDPDGDAHLSPPADDPDSEGLDRSVKYLPGPSYFFSRLNLSAPVLRARAYATARGVYRLYINGERIGDHELAPGWTDYRNRIYYQSYDVTPVLQQGANGIGMVVADGWYSGFLGMSQRKHGQIYGDHPEAWFQLVVDHVDGSRTVFCSGGDWVVGSGPLRFADLQMGEFYDARRVLARWSMPDFVPPADWEVVATAPLKEGLLMAQPDEPVRAVEEIQAISLSPTAESGWIVDFGQNMAGRVRITLRGCEHGQRVRLRHAEMLTADGGLYRDNLRSAVATDYYICGGGSVEVFEPQFTMHGFRYLEVTGLAYEPEPEDVLGVVVRSDVPWSGGFESSSTLLQRLQQNILWSQRGNLVSVPTDCPQRDERLAWLADASLFLPTALRNAEVLPLFRRWLDEIRRAQSAEGAFPDIVPNIYRRKIGAPAWASGGVLMPWTLYRHSGMIEILEESYDSMRRMVDFVSERNPDHVWRHGIGRDYGDWLQLGAVTSPELVSTAFFARCAEVTAKAARVLGLHEEADHYVRLREEITAAFTERYLLDDGTVAGGSQTGHSLALAFDLVPAEARLKVGKGLVDALDRAHGHIATGIIGTAFICPALTSIGREDLAYRLALAIEYPSWGYSIEHGATTIWERWDGHVEGKFQAADMNSFNHYALGSVGEWLYEQVAGLGQTPDSVGYQELLIRPRLGGALSSAAAWLQTPAGRAEVAWRRAGERFALEAEVPPGSTARFELPWSNIDRITESGRPLTASEGLEILNDEKGLVVRSGSGTFNFEFPLADQASNTPAWSIAGQSR